MYNFNIVKLAYQHVIINDYVKPAKKLATD